MIFPEFPTHKQSCRAILRWYRVRPSIFHPLKLFRWYKKGAFFIESQY